MTSKETIVSRKPYVTRTAFGPTTPVRNRAMFNNRTNAEIKKMVNNDPSCISYLPYRPEYIKLIEDLIKSNSNLIPCLDPKYLTKKSIKKALREDLVGIRVSLKSGEANIGAMLKDEEFCCEIMKIMPSLVASIPESFLTEKTLIAAVSEDPYCINFIPMSARTEAVQIKAVKNQPDTILKTNNLCRSALEAVPKTSEYWQTAQGMISDLIKKGN